jgi:hypothetical protein
MNNILNSKNKHIIAIDLDGVLNNYIGNYSETIIPTPKEGVFDFLQTLSKNFNIEIFTARNPATVKEWLKKNNLEQFISNITNNKNPKARLFIDDRAINFKGSYSDTIQEVLNFKPYWVE